MMFCPVKRVWIKEIHDDLDRDYRINIVGFVDAGQQRKMTIAKVVAWRASQSLPW